MVKVDSYSVTNDLSPEFKEYEELVQLQRAVDQKNNQERFDFAEKDAKERQPLHKALEAEIKQFDAQAPTGSVFYPATLNYERGLFIGNLLFKLKSPSAVIQPRTAEHVKQAITLTKKLVEVAAKTSENTSSAIKPRLTVKGGGHSYAGHCVNQNGIVLDMQQMNQIEIVSDGKELRIGAGCLWKDVYNYLETHAPNKIVVGGLCPFVGVAGFTLGGGIGPFSRSYGLGIDNVTEITVVTAKGDELVLNKDKPRNDKEGELFWALCGGGGGNFGVVTEFKTALHDLENEVCFGQLTWHLDDPKEKEKFMDMMDKFNTSYSDDDKEWSRKLTTDAIWRFKHGELLGQMTVVYKGNMEECWKALSPLHEFIINDKKHNTINQMPWRKLVVIEEGFDIKTRIYHWHTSFVLSKGQITRDLVEKIIALLKLTHTITGDTKSHVLWSQMGGKVSDYASDATSFPWRTGVYPINFKLQWTKPEKREEIEHLIHTAKYILQPHAIDKSASYLNYIDGTLDNWQQAYYGQNYGRLKRAKLDWDPDNFFEFRQSIEREGHERAHIAAQSLSKEELEAIEADIKKNPTDGLNSLYDSVRNMTSQVDLQGQGFAQKDEEGDSTETEIQEPGFFEKSMEQWREFSLPDPSDLEEIEGLKADEIFKIFARQRLEAHNI